MSLFPSDFLEVSAEELAAAADDEHTLDRECFSEAKNVVLAYTTGRDLVAALTALNTFQVKFTEWKKFDFQRHLRSLANTYHQWVASIEHLESSREETRDPESLQEIIDHATRQRDATKRRILQFGGPEAWEEVLATPPVRINLEEIIQELGSKKYWEEFGDELRAQPPKYDRIAVLLTQIRDRIKDLVPNRSDIHATIDRSLDIDFIRQMIEFGSFDSESFFRVFEFIWTTLKDLGAASAEPEWIEWRQSILTRTQDGSSTYDVLLPNIFNRFLVQLDRIEDATARYRAMMSQNQGIPAQA